MDIPTRPADKSVGTYSKLWSGILWFNYVPRGYNTMADGGQIMRFKLDSNGSFKIWFSIEVK